MPTLRVFILAQDPLARAGLAALLSDPTEWVAVDEPESGGDVIDSLDLHGPDVLVWDMGWDAETELGRFSEYRGMLQADAGPAAERRARRRGVGLRQRGQ